MPLRPCIEPGCKELVKSGRCVYHQKKREQAGGQVDRRRRGSASSRGYGSRWRRERETFLKQNPFCVTCMQSGVVTMAKVVDHIADHKGNYNLMWDTANWQPLCDRCHRRKTVAQNPQFKRRK